MEVGFRVAADELMLQSSIEGGGSAAGERT